MAATIAKAIPRQKPYFVEGRADSALALARIETLNLERQRNVIIDATVIE